jgi:hypothetical protein
MLDLLHSAAERRLGDVQTPGRARKAQLFGDSLEIAKMAQVEHDGLKGRADSVD